MSKIRNALESLAGRFSPPSDALARVARFKERRQHRRRIAVGAAALAATTLTLTIVVLAFGRLSARQSSGPAIKAAAAPASATASSATASASATPVPSDTATPLACPSVGPGGYTPVFSVNSGASGSTVTVSGAVPHLDESGAFVYETDGRIQLWWNVDPDQYALLTPGSLKEPPPAKPGGILLLNEQNVSNLCAFAIDFQVPNVPPGTYPILVLNVGGDSAHLEGFVTFEVTG